MQIIKVPGLNNLQKNNGCRNAGNAILAELRGLVKISDLNVEEIHVDNFKLDEQEKLIYENSKQAFEIQDKVIFLGGDHSVSYPIGKAFLETFGEKNSYLVIFDAHADCMNVWDEIKYPDHEEWLSSLVKKGFDAKKIILIGLRKIEPEEKEFLDSNGIQYWEMGKFSDMEILCDSIMEFVNKKNAKFYLSIDIDVIDPAFAPSTGYLEPGGFTSREILYFVRRLRLLKNLKAVDIVEVDSEKDSAKNNSITIKLAAKILSEFL